MFKLGDKVVKVGMEELGSGTVRGATANGVVVFWGTLHGTHRADELRKAKQGE